MSSAAPQPDPPIPATPPEGVTRAELEALQARLDEFARASDELAASRTAEEEERNAREAREAASRVEATAQRIGLTPADVTEIRTWIREETRAATREALEEIADVRRDEGGDPPPGDPPPGDPPAGDPPAASLADLANDPTRTPAGDPPAGDPPPPPPAEPEHPPQREHWFHRELGGKAAGGDGDA